MAPGARKAERKATAGYARGCGAPRRLRHQRAFEDELRRSIEIVAQMVTTALALWIRQNRREILISACGGGEQWSQVPTNNRMTIAPPPQSRGTYHRASKQPYAEAMSRRKRESQVERPFWSGIMASTRDLVEIDYTVADLSGVMQTRPVIINSAVQTELE